MRPSLVSQHSVGSVSLEPVRFNILKLNEEDFPDVCVECQQCLKSIREAIMTHTNHQIKDPDIASLFIESAMQEMTNVLREREAGCDGGDGHEHAKGTRHHKHHTHTEHHHLETQVSMRLGDSRRMMLQAEKEKRKFKFN